MKGKKGKKTPTPPPQPEENLAEVQEEPSEIKIDGQMMTLSDSNILNTNQITGYKNKGDSLFIPDDASSILLEDEEEGMIKVAVLTQEIVVDSLSNVGCSACGTKQVFLNLSLPGFGLQDISLLQKYIYLQKLNLSYNSLSELSALNCMRYLIELDVSHNELTSLLDFQPPFGLQEANFSHNLIESMTDLSAYDHLVKLNLDHNNIVAISGLKDCRSLLHLTLSHNNIEEIGGLDKLKIRHLNLSYNQLTQIENLDTVLELQELDLSGNSIFGLIGLTSSSRLYSLNLEGNQVSSLSEIQHIDSTTTLRILNFLKNPIVNEEEYRKSVIFAMQQLSELDHQVVTVEEKVAAVNLFDPPAEVQAALDHITHTVYRFLQPSKIYESTLPSIEMPYPMLVLTGPQACGKRELARRLAQEFPDYFGFGISHTTRVPYPGEQDGKDYHFVTPDHFQILVRQGCFVQTFKHDGCLYGLTLDAVESVAKEGLACVVHMEINGIRTLKNTYFEPRFVLLLPVSSEAHRERMVERGVYTEAQVNYVTQQRKAMYQEVNQEHPGFFDMVINSDKLGEAYDRLRQLVMDYLGTTDLTNVEGESVQPRLSTTENKDESSTHHTTMSAHRRTWSRPSFQGESATTNDLNSANNKAKLESRKTPVEEASIRRRQHAAIEAVEGFSPSVYDDLFRRPMVPMTAPGMLEGSPMAQAASMYQDPALLAALYPGMTNENFEVGMAQHINGKSNTKSNSSTPDSSNRSQVASSGLSGLSSARGFSDQESGKEGKCKEAIEPSGLSEQVLDLTALSDALESLRGSSRTITPLAPRLVQGFDEWLGIGRDEGDRGGANTKPVVPSIPTGGRLTVE
ncbi:leucine-rich repeat and guanylate kinase domain-containing protein-like [Clavelina lepadiformis]|uniref:leucine-rich repeat and guanylate kinase domain-containing protein-like n=1 Tax=Clavelina lepadiformis TaxID=159417 RepID=UPI004043328F